MASSLPQVSRQALAQWYIRSCEVIRMNWKNLQEYFSPIIDVWLTFVDAFTWVLTRFVLLIAFFSVFLTYGVILRVINKDPMSRSIGDYDSYWNDNVVNNNTIDDFRSMY